MNGQAVILLELGLIGSVLGWACWDLWSLRRSQARDREAAAACARQADGEDRPDAG